MLAVHPSRRDAAFARRLSDLGGERAGAVSLAGHVGPYGEAVADQREIATVLLSAEAGEPRWRSRSPGVRSRVQRLVRSALAMEAGGFWALLSGRVGSRRALR